MEMEMAKDPFLEARFYRTELIESTLLLNEGIPRAYQGKKLHLKNILFFPSKSEGITCRF